MVAHWKPSRQLVHAGAAGTGAALLGEAAAGEADGVAAVELLGLGLAFVSVGELLPPQADTVTMRAVRTRGSWVRRTAPSCGTSGTEGERHGCGATGSLSGRESAVSELLGRGEPQRVHAAGTADRLRCQRVARLRDPPAVPEGPRQRLRRV